MRHVWIITFVCAFYGLANGLLLNATPQAGLALQFRSADIGLIGSGLPIGYATSCLIFFALNLRARGKFVLLCGIAVSFVAMLAMARARTVAGCLAAQISYGLACGAFWPFCSAWLLDFQTEGIPKTRLLRHYNVSWTAGTSVGMFAAGVLCERHLIGESFLAGAAILAGVFLAACLPHAPAHAARPADDPSPNPLPQGEGENNGAHYRVGFPLVLAAVIANLAALGSRTIVLNIYPELNRVLEHGADRMGVLAGLSLVSQLLAFLFGAMYERWLGLRRVYVFLALSLVAINLAMAFSGSLAVLAAATVLHGLVLAVAFQTGIFAATGYFSTPRGGTTFHESIIGIAGIAPLAAGALVTRLMDGGTPPREALTAPFLLMTGVIALALVVQIFLVSSRHAQRVLLTAHSAAPQSPAASR